MIVFLLDCDPALPDTTFSYAILACNELVYCVPCSHPTTCDKGVPAQREVSRKSLRLDRDVVLGWEGGGTLTVIEDDERPCLLWGDVSAGVL